MDNQEEDAQIPMNKKVKLDKKKNKKAEKKSKRYSLLSDPQTQESEIECSKKRQRGSSRSSVDLPLLRTTTSPVSPPRTPINIDESIVIDDDALAPPLSSPVGPLGSSLEIRMAQELDNNNNINTSRGPIREQGNQVSETVVGASASTAAAAVVAEIGVLAASFSGDLVDPKTSKKKKRNKKKESKISHSGGENKNDDAPAAAAAAPSGSRDVIDVQCNDPIGEEGVVRRKKREKEGGKTTPHGGGREDARSIEADIDASKREGSHQPPEGGRKKRKRKAELVEEKGWKPVEMDLEMMEFFDTEGGVMIEEITEEHPEYAKYMVPKTKRKNDDTTKGRERGQEREASIRAPTDGNDEAHNYEDEDIDDDEDDGESSVPRREKKKASNKEKEKNKKKKTKKKSNEDKKKDNDVIKKNDKKESKNKKKLLKKSKNNYEDGEDEDEADKEEEELDEEDWIIEDASANTAEWQAFNLKPELLVALGKRGFSHPTPIQNACLHAALAGKDVVGAAETGSGKTLAFGLPILSKLHTREEDSLYAMIILPTRELANQVQQHMDEIINFAGMRKSTCCLVGGMSVEKQNRILDRKPPIVIGTPGRVAALAFGEEMHPWLKKAIDTIKVFVLDEADRLVEPGHFKDLKRILKKLYPEKGVSCIQTFIFSATLPQEEERLNELFQSVPMRANYCQVDLTKNVADNSTSLPDQLALHTLPGQDSDRETLLTHVMFEHLKGPDTRKKVLIFVNAVSYVYRLTSVLQLLLGSNKGHQKLQSLMKKPMHDRLPVRAEVLGMHSKMKQKDRYKTLDTFKSSDQCILITTDLAARGLDIPDIATVVHFQVPRSRDIFIHRSGRTARAGREGLALCMVSPQDRDKWTRSTQNVRQGFSQITPYGTTSSKELSQCRLLFKIASDLDKALLETSRKSKDAAWFRRTAEEADLLISDDELEQDGHIEKERKQKLCALYNQMMNRLMHKK